jgi:hypothetical protein
MKKILTGGGIVLLAILTTAPCSAETGTDSWTRPFVGVDIGYAIPTYDRDMEDDISDGYLSDKSFVWVPTIKAGLRFGHNDSIYNGGITASYAKYSGIKLEEGWAAKSAGGDIDVKMDAGVFHVTYDNYIRVYDEGGRRNDIVIGFGFGRGSVKESVKIARNGIVLVDESETDSGSVGVFKIGFVGDTAVKGLAYSIFLTSVANGNDKDDDLQGLVSFDFGLRYTF